MARNKRIVYYLVGVLLFLLILFFLAEYQGFKVAELHITFCDVGQGDAILIQLPQDQDILIDGGPDKLVLDCLGKHLPYYDKDIELVILTHPHADHVTGLVSVLERYKVDKIVLTKVNSLEAAYQELRQLIEDKNIPVVTAMAGGEFDFSKDASLNILFPFIDLENKDFKDLNDTSVVTKFNYKNNKFLFVGDAGVNVENQLMMAGQDLSADLLKVGHHGSSGSSSEIFLKAVGPKLAVIQVGMDNSFGHPSGRIVGRLERLGIKIFRTDLDGEVEVESDGNNIKIYGENGGR